MFGFKLAFDSTVWLALLALVPVLWVLSFRSLSGLGKARRIVALTLRTAVLALLVLALAEMQWQRTHDRMTVIYLLDQSASIPPEQRQAMLRYVAREVGEHRDGGRGDKAGVIIFGRQANIEVPPLDAELPTVGQLETLLDLRTDATNLSAALKLAQATFPEDSSKRVVIITDGNENLGNAQSIAKMLTDDGVGIDVIPIPLMIQTEVAVEKVALPTDIRKGQPFEARVVVNNLTQTADADGVVRGTIKLSRRIGPQTETLAEEDVELPTGKSVFRFEHEIEQANFYEYQATFVAADPTHDQVAQNNRATAFTHVRGRGHVLLIENWETKGEFDFLVESLRKMNLEVTVQTSERPFTSLAELQAYDTVVLANVPRTSGDVAGQVTNFTDAQIDMLVRNTQQMGAGLVMLGGPQSFGAGGWANTELEKAMPVDFQIRNAKVVPVGALVLVMHASEMAQGNHWQKVVGREALKALGPQDYCGVVHWDHNRGGEAWLWGGANGLTRVGPNRKQMLAKMGAMTPGDMPNFDPSMKLAVAGLSNLPQAAVKHMIIISDGDPSPPTANTIRLFQQAQTPVTTVAVGTHGPPSTTPLRKISQQTGGKFYNVTNPKALPRIFQREARRVARPLVYEAERGLTPTIKYPHEMLGDIDRVPPITGFVLTHVKDNPLVEVSIVSPRPEEDENATILASWTYGVGRSVVFTSDAGNRWATQWTGWEQYDKMFSQMIRWSMRPMGEQGKFSVATERIDDQVRIVVTALDQDDEFLNFLNMGSMVVGPDMKPIDVPIRQIAPGRYVGQFDADRSGSYLVAVMPGGGRAPIRTGVNIPYSPEYGDRETNAALLQTLVELEPTDGEKGKLIDGSLAEPRFERLMQFDTFRRDLARAVSSSSVWPLLLVITGCVFLVDVFVRRVNVSFAWVGPQLARARNYLLRRDAAPTEREQRMARLRSRKEEIDQQLDQRRAAARFDPTVDEDVDLAALDERPQAAPPAASTDQPALHEPSQEEETYMDRLLKAKQQAQRDKKE